MSTPDIPVLTKVHSKPNQKPQIGEASESLNMANVIAQVKLALLPELQTMIQQQLLQTAPDFEVDTSLIEKQLQETQLALMTQARKDMEQDGERLTKELTTNISQAISEKISGMQELAVNQARSQIGNTIVSIEEGFKEAIQDYAKKQEETLAGFFEQHAQQTKAQMADKAKNMSDQLLSAVGAYSQKLIEEGKAKLDNEQQALQVDLIEKSKQSLAETFAEVTQSQQKSLTEATQIQQASFAEIIRTQQQLFTDQLSAKLPEFQQALSEKVNVMVADEMQRHMKAIETELTSKLKLHIVEVLQGIKFVFPNGNPNANGQQTNVGGQ